MFGLVSQKDLKELNKVVTDMLDNMEYVYRELNTIKQELHGTQASLYSLINNLSKDLVLDKKGNPKVKNRSKK